MTNKTLVMQAESNIFDSEKGRVASKSGFYDFKLLKTTTSSLLYVALNEGKRFLVKTTKDNTERQIAMLRREYELSIGCDHPHIVHGYTFDPNLPVGAGIVMEYVEGRTLSEYLNEDPSLKERERIFEELLSAVEYLHLRSILHNDLKPDNILVTRVDNRVKLIDLGLADSDTDYALRTLGCTPRYASPELQHRSTDIDARSDIYSLGCIMQELFPHRYQAVVKRACASTPHDRYLNVAHMRSVWVQHRGLPRRLLIASSLLLLLIGLLVWPNLRTLPSERDYAAQCRQFEEEVEVLCRCAIDSMAPIPFYNWTEVIAWEYEARLDSCRVRAMRAFDNPQRSTDFEVFSASCVEACKARISRATWEGGKLYIHQSSSLSAEERAFYSDLFFSGKPYRPYSTE